ncbi:methyltransferase domain-containing protein [Candidatus Oleimmundimicrobium sp.]|uniref:class I SAM-dependent methyltransferase n=1 Tax=Candidatus Oleimmundimicrobium sp. TaxID=3060597 RepID=UPI00271B7A7B|nr:methyltransferase domain-containing protein [Candidatus Oleimmundimicrobium sp.]MDO8886941.1 methyltransferase domain-containing protein [Candidatus Oleimmundimicrobium sp.]
MRENRTTKSQNKQLNEALLEIKKCQEESRELGNQDAIVQENNLLLFGYKAIAEEIIAELPEDAKILDWGGGFGFLSFFLQQLGRHVTYFDLKLEEKWMPLLKQLKIPKVYLNDETKLPFENESFDAVISCGVLEHVSKPKESLAELHRIIKPGGLLFVYHFPNRFSYIEHLASKKGQEAHAYKLSKKELRELLNRRGFKVVSLRYKYLLPRNLSQFPKIRKLFSKKATVIFMIDYILSLLPVLNVLSTTSNAVAVKEKDKP